MSKGLYIHYPFCEAKCLYCDFFSVPDLRKRREYEKALALAIKSYKEKNYDIDTIYFGGGTPAIMTSEGIDEVFSAINESFNILPDSEITLEINPTCTENLEAFFKKGVNRLSLGAQSFNDNELELLGRRHKAKDVEDTVLCARNIGFDNISLDLMVRIPQQTKKSFLESLEKAIELDVSHISLYTLSIEENTVFGFRARKGETLFLASEEDEEEMYFEGSKRLAKQGFEHYEVSNFAKDGEKSRHNLKYWHAEEYIGIGASSHSYLDGVRFYQDRGINSFIENPTKTLGHTIIDEKEKALEQIMLGLRLREGVFLPELENKMLVKKLLENGLARYEKGVLSLTDKGFRVSNSIIEEVLCTVGLI